MSVGKTASIDNDFYERCSDTWWQEEGVGALLRHVSNPWRVPYFQRILDRAGLLESGSACLLDVGCGGGVLAEEFAAMGLKVIGLDQSEKSLEAARVHAHRNGLGIDYRLGSANNLPFGEASFDLVCCCDVLEHVRDWNAVVADVARVLKPGGIFLYDTINRTKISKLLFIKLAQDWTFFSFFPRNLHVWDMFITPGELAGSLRRHGLRNMEIRGTAPPGNPLRMLMALRGLKKGRLSPEEFGRRVGGSIEGPNIDANYMGYAIKPL